MSLVRTSKIGSVMARTLTDYLVESKLSNTYIFVKNTETFAYLGVSFLFYSPTDIESAMRKLW